MLQNVTFVLVALTLNFMVGKTKKDKNRTKGSRASTKAEIDTVVLYRLGDKFGFLEWVQMH